MNHTQQTRRCGALHAEAFRFTGLLAPFPPHFHEHYVFGLMEQGSRPMICNGRSYFLSEGDLLLLAPGDVHQCESQGPAIYAGLNLSPSAIGRASRVLRIPSPPPLAGPLLSDPAAARLFCRLHQCIFTEASIEEKEETLVLLLALLLRPDPQEDPLSVRPDALLSRICAHLQSHFRETISLGALCQACDLSRSTLFRLFARHLSISPYRYVESLRVNEAKRLLRRGTPLADTALAAGFSDQSHFTHFFTAITGLTPAAYQRMYPKKS